MLWVLKVWRVCNAAEPKKKHSQRTEISVVVLRISGACQQVKRKQDHISSSGHKATDQDSIFALCKTLGHFGQRLVLKIDTDSL